MDKLTTDHRFIGIDFPPNKFNFNEPLPPALRTAWRHEQMRETTAVASMMDRRSIDRDGQVASSAGAKQHGDEKMAVKELNFFAIDDRSKGERAAPGAVKSEIAEDCAVEDAEVHPETGLNLLTENIGSERSIAVAEEEQEVQEDAATGSNKQQRHLTSTELIAKSNLSVLKAELDKMNMENQQLKSMLCQVNTNYYALQMHFQTLMQRHVAITGAQLDSEEVIRSVPEDREILEGVVAVNSLHMEMSKPKRARKGENSQSSLSEDRSMLGCSVSPQNNIVESMEHWTSAPTVTSPTQVISNNLNNPKRSDDEFVDRRLLMRGDSSWTPHRAQKHGFSDGGDRAAAAQSMSMIRKARVSVRARSEAATIADGCQWRKYGQKIAKGNPCPRGYYRCSMSVACPVRKQVQRCVEDRTVLITTYEGQHNHPLPEAAMAMASTTSSAASMLLSGSMPSSDGIIGGNSQYTARTSFPNCPPTLATLSTTAPFPTITLDLTQTTPPNIANPMQLQRPIMPLNQVQLLQLLSNQTQAPVGDASKDARTAAIVGDPNFAAALLTAITSIIGDGRADNAGGAGDRDHVVGDKDDNSHDV